VLEVFPEQDDLPAKHIHIIAIHCPPIGELTMLVVDVAYEVVVAPAASQPMKEVAELETRQYLATLFLISGS
jgi:hypothetical protein